MKASRQACKVPTGKFEDGCVISTTPASPGRKTPTICAGPAAWSVRRTASAWLAQGRAKREKGDWAGARESLGRLTTQFAPEFLDAACREDELTAEAEERALELMRQEGEAEIGK